ADRNRSHWSTSKTPSYTKSVSWHHYRIFLPDFAWHSAVAAI
ncbi:transposase, partial [Escherichia coli]